MSYEVQVCARDGSCSSLCVFWNSSRTGSDRLVIRRVMTTDPETYTYPTDTAYPSGSFDITGFKLKVSGDQANIEVNVATKLDDPWGMGVGFAVQMIFVFIDTDQKEGSKYTKGLPGLNIAFAPG